ncbi:hypothetical protein VNI00_000456 [Paramarasmius palmivorus]|uniref:Uncharacterized protein n=1 Tax=Paramarasmius palmivorus TaxID=297713 RepID=A0AAW0E9F3_9AGAR
MAFNGSSNFTVESAINIVHRDQHIQNINFQIGRTEEQRQVERKEDGLELIDQYREILHGDIYKVEKTGSTWEEDRDAQFGNKCTGRRTYYRARIYGDDKVYTGVIYSGRDASKLWKEDFAKYSGSHDLDDSAMIWQLHRINRSKVPALIFYDEWLPMAHFCPNEANIFTIMYAQLLAPLTRLSEVEDWLNSKPFFWSFDENGTTHIPESTCAQLGLPTLTLSEPAGVRFELWPKYTYDAVYKWQVAKGFDPSTLDFARSLGVPIFDDDRLAEESQFKEVVKEEQENPTESESPNTSDVGGSFMSRLTTSASRWFQPEAAPGIPVL